MKKANYKPTDAELEILQVFWLHGPCTVRQVHQYLASEPPRRYTTILKLLQIMSEKGLVKRDETQRAHVYDACLSADNTRQSLVMHLVDRAFNGSASKLAMQALASRKSTPAELEEIRRMLDEMEGRNDE